MQIWRINKKAMVAEAEAVRVAMEVVSVDGEAVQTGEVEDVAGLDPINTAHIIKNEMLPTSPVTDVINLATL